MSDREDNKNLSRRERRRAQLEERAQTPDEDEAEAEVEAGESDESAAEDEESEETEGESEEQAARAESESKPGKPSKTDKKRSRQEERSATANVRDRNKRLREQAAQKRRGKRDREREAAVARGLDASEMVDDVLARGTHRTVEFIRRHFSMIQWVVVLGIAAGIGWSIYSWKSKKNVAKSSDVLMAGVEAELGRVMAEPAKPEEAKLDPRPHFTTEEARLQAAAQGYDNAEKASPGSGTAILAKLGRAGVLYDEGKFDEAKANYEAVLSSPLAKHDADVRLRAVEGIGMSLEAKGDADGSLKWFQDLEKAEEPGFSALGLYHQARVALNKGDKQKAKELLGKVNEKLEKERSPYAAGSYLERASRDLMAIVDPTTAPASPASYTPEQLAALKEQIAKDPTKLKKMLEDLGKMKVPEPMAPPPLPEELPLPEEPAPAPSGAP